MAQLKDLTIVIPSYKRQKFILRQINYWSNFDVKVLIFDGSPLGIDLSAIPGAQSNVKYYHEPISIKQRLRKAALLVDTKFSTMLSDDEFFIPSALLKCMDFLENNSDYSSCKGRALWFNWSGEAVIGGVGYPQMDNYSIINDDRDKRVYNHISDYEMATLWSVQRTDIFSVAMIAAGSGANFQSAAVTELQFSISSAFMGKIKVINDLMWLRSMENSNVWNASTQLSFKDWWRDSSLSAEHQQFFNDIDQALLTISGTPLCKFNLVQALENFCTNDNKRNRTIEPFKQLLRRIDRSFLFRGFFSKLIRFCKKPKVMKLTEAAKARSKDGTLIDLLQLHEIINLISLNYQQQTNEKQR